MPLLSEISGIRPTSRLYKENDTFPLPRGIVGIEIELENAPLLGDAGLDSEYWTITNDGSLRNNGVEFVSTPLFGQDLLDAISMWGDWLTTEAGQRSEVTSRCSIHLHLDVSGFSTSQLLALYCAVALAKDSLYRYVGEDRRDNLYCLPISHTDNILPLLNQIKYGQNRSAIQRAIRQTQKYSGFNILPILSQGSVEFRHHGGTKDPQKIIKWIKICQRLIKVAMEYDGVALTEMEYNELNDVLFGEESEELKLTDDGHTSGYLTAKDILNFNKLDDVWCNISSIYSDPANLNW